MHAVHTVEVLAMSLMGLGEVKVHLAADTEVAGQTWAPANKQGIGKVFVA